MTNRPDSIQDPLERTDGLGRLPLGGVAAALVFVVGEGVARRTGATANVIWAPTTPYRATLLAATFSPIATVTRWRARDARSRRVAR